ncbi:MAG: phospho-sugar mutase, partial [Ginsengibacter sp.]
MEAKTENKINEWLSGNYDSSVKDEINRLKKDEPSQLEDAFYRDLEFGTGGLRGVMGVGTNRMNKYTVGMATQGYVNYLKQCFDEVKVAIAHDSRNNSREFAEIAANIFAANDIKVY